MKREIKFRAFCGEKMMHPHGVFINGDRIRLMFYGAHEKDECLEYTSIPFNLKEPLHLMQYTGINAKNGPIYEGDIVEWPGWDKNRYQVCYDRWGIPALAGISNCEGGDFKEFEMNHNATPQKCVILGNIYENPELLEAK